MLLSEMLHQSLSASKMSNILSARFGVHVHAYKHDDMSLCIDTSDMYMFNMTPKELNEFVNKFGWYVSGYGSKLIVLRKNKLLNSNESHYYLKGSKIEPELAKKIGLRAKSYNDLTEDPEDFKAGSIYSDKRNYVWSIVFDISDFNSLLHLVEVASEYGKYVYLVKLTDNVYKDPEYEAIDEPACFITRTILPYEILGGFTGKYVDIATQIQALLKNS